MPLKDIMKNTPPKKYFKGKTYIYLNFKSNERGFAVCNQKSYRSILNLCTKLMEIGIDEDGAVLLLLSIL